MMPTFHFHKLSGNMDGFFAIDVKTRRDPWRIIIQPLDENEEPYDPFVRMNEFSENAIRRFAERIDRDPGIVLGRLQNDQIVPFTNVALSKALKHKYKVITS